jgi:Tol biopolymer transport system component
MRSSLSVVVVWCLVTSCGRIGFDELTRDATTDSTVVDVGADAMDAASDADAASDTSLDVAPDAMVMLGPFGPATPIAELNTAGREDDPTLPGDRLEIFFSSDRVGGMGNIDVWTASRTSVTDTWSTPMNVAELNSSVIDAGPEVSFDGLTITLSSDRSGSMSQDIWISTRPARGSPWATPTRVAELASATVDGGGISNASGTRIVFHSDRSGNHDLFEATRAGTLDPWGAAVPLTALNTTSRDLTPHLSPDFRTIYFASDRPGAGGRDLYEALRPNVDAPFGAPTPLAGVNSAETDADPWVSPDGRHIVFARGGTLGDDLYEASR